MTRDEIVAIREKPYRVIRRALTEEAFRPGAVIAHLIVIANHPNAYTYRAVDEIYQGPGRWEYRFASREAEQIPDVDYSERRL